MRSCVWSYHLSTDTLFDSLPELPVHELFVFCKISYRKAFGAGKTMLPQDCHHFKGSTVAITNLFIHTCMVSISTLRTDIFHTSLLFSSSVSHRTWHEKLDGCFKKKQRTLIMPVHLVRVANILLVFSVVSFGFYMLFIIFIAVFFDLSLFLDIRVLDIDLTFISLNLLFLVSYKS